MIRSIYEIIRNFVRKAGDDFISAFSAQTAFFIIISFFPFAMFLLTLLHYLPLSETELLMTVPKVLPDEISTLVSSIILEMNEKASGTLLSVTVVVALWSAARGFLAMIRGLNGVYRIKETRNYFLLRLIASIYTFIFTIVIVISLAILVFGNSLYYYTREKYPFFAEILEGIISLRTIVGFCILVLFFLCLYIFIPNRSTRPINQLPGALVAASGWILFSYAYSYYIDHMSNFSYMYGSLAAIVLCMLWVYFCMYILFIGAEINVVLEYKELLHDIENLKKEFVSSKTERLNIPKIKAEHLKLEQQSIKKRDQMSKNTPK